MSGKKVLVIGGNSFIARVFMKDRKETLNLRPVARNTTGFSNEILVDDYGNIPDQAFQWAETVINFAAIVHEPKIKDEDIYREINYKLPLSLAKASKNAGCRHFIQISTIAVYGGAQKIDKDTKTQPITPYGIYKLKADLELAELSSNKFSVSCIRPSMVYGGGDAPGNLKSLIRLVKTGLPLPFAGIENKRQFLNVHNLAEALQLIIDKRIEDTILIADEEAISLSQLVKTIANEAGLKDRSFKLSFFWRLVKTLKPSIYKKLAGSLEIANTYSFSELGVTKSHSVKDGIREMV